MSGRVRRTVLNDIMFVIGGTAMITVMIIGMLFNLYASYTMKESLVRSSTKTAHELAKTMETLLYSISDNTIVDVANAYLSTGKLNGIRIDSSVSGVVIDVLPVRTSIIPPIEMTIVHEDLYLGTIKLWFDDSELDETRRSLLVITASIILGVLVAYLLSARFVLRNVFAAPFNRILHGIEQIATGNYEHKIPSVRQEDLNILIDTINRMSENILRSNLLISENEKRYSAIFNSSFVAIFLQDFSGKIVDVNDTMIAMYGLGSKVEALGCDFRKDYSAANNDFTALDRVWSSVMNGNDEFIAWIARRPKDGTTFHIEVTLKRICVSNGDFILANVIDVSQRCRIEEQLVQAQKMEAIGTIAGGLAHDFNNILGGITGTVSLLQLKAEVEAPIDRETLFEHLKMINDAAFRAANVVGKLLTLSKKREYRLVPIDLNDVIGHVVNLAENTLDRSVIIDVADRSTPHPINGDQTQLEQLLLNLFVNSAQAMTVMRPRGAVWGGDLKVSVERCEPDEQFRKLNPQARAAVYWVVSVNDTGVGIPADNISKIFLPFFTTKEKGTGLGLSMVYNIVKSHDGFLTVHSEPGLGTTFNIYLPCLLVSATSIKPVAESPMVYKGNGLILVIDDEDLVRNYLRNILREFGFTVLDASDGDEGVRIFRENRERIEFVLLDMVMPRLSGRETFNEIRKMSGNIKIILMSGFREDERFESIIDKGNAGFLQKPFDTSTLISTIRHVIDG